MRILIGTPIHQVKNYSMDRWLKNVANLISQTPADLLIVDNSPGTDYIKKIRTDCVKFGIKNYRIMHLEIDQSLGIDIRIEASQETIRQYVITHGYDGWFSWECDQIIPSDTLNKLIQIMKSGDFMMVVANSWARWDPAITNTNMGCTLLSRKWLKKNFFLPVKQGKISLDLTDSYDINDPTVFKKRTLKTGGNYVEIYGIINPIYHLNE